MEIKINTARILQRVALLCLLIVGRVSVADIAWGFQGGADFATAGSSHSTGLFMGLNASLGLSDPWDVYAELNGFSIPSSLYYAGILVYPQWRFRMNQSFRFLFGLGPEVLLKVDGLGRKPVNFNWNLGAGLEWEASRSILMSIRARYAIGLVPLNNIGPDKLNGLIVGLSVQFLTDPTSGNAKLPADAFPLQERPSTLPIEEAPTDDTGSEP